jgi:hypothetical protein
MRRIGREADLPLWDPVVVQGVVLGLVLQDLLVRGWLKGGLGFRCPFGHLEDLDPGLVLMKKAVVVVALVLVQVRKAELGPQWRTWIEILLLEGIIISFSLLFSLFFSDARPEVRAVACKYQF